MALQQSSGIVLKFDGLARNIHRNCAAVHKIIRSGQRPLNDGVCPWPKPYRKNLCPDPVKSLLTSLLLYSVLHYLYAALLKFFTSMIYRCIS